MVLMTVFKKVQHLILIGMIFYASTSEANVPPPLQLANKYYSGIPVQEYWLSEKLDGVRAYWNGQDLISRQGYRLHAPAWFTANFPAVHLDGELWLSRGQFAEVSGIVRQQNPEVSDWQKVHYWVFDLPNVPGTFTQRIAMMKMLSASVHSDYLRWVPQFKIEKSEDLTQLLDDIVKKGGEGLMLHRGDSFYRAARNDDLLKMKTYEDEEAIVIAYIPGQGKYKNQLGALLVENAQKVRFKIGTGFTDAQRKNPPPIGSLITYKYVGKTKNNIPRFASFLRSRTDV